MQRINLYKLVLLLVFLLPVNTTFAAGKPNILVEAISPAIGLATGQPGELLESSIRENCRRHLSAR